METVTRRAALDGGLAAALTFLGSADAKAAGAPATPWIKRIFHLYTGSDGKSVVEMIPVPAPESGDRSQLLRRNAERLTLGAMSPNTMLNFHNANQPTLLIPLFGSVVVKLADGKTYEAVHGDIIYAEDCTGTGHISGAGNEGNFVVQIQLPKPLCPSTGSSDMSKFWKEPA